MILNFKIIVKSTESGKQILSVTEIEAELTFAYKMWIPVSSFILFPHQCNLLSSSYSLPRGPYSNERKLKKRLISFSQNHKLWFSEKEDKSDSFRTKVGEIKWSQSKMWLKKREREVIMKTFNFFLRRRVSGFSRKYFSFWSLYVDIDISEKQQHPYIMVIAASG